MNDDLDAIQRVLADDVESFRRLVDRYQRPLLTLVRSLLTNAQVVISPWSDHILEFADPVLVNAAVKAAKSCLGRIQFPFARRFGKEMVVVLSVQV